VTRYSHAATDGVNIYLQARPFGYSAKSSNGGTSWTQQTSWPTYSGTSGLKCIGNSGNIIVSDVSDGLIYQSVNGGTSFNGYSLPRSLGTDTISANANNVIVGGNNGVSFYVEYSSNGGSSYNETTIGVGGPTLIFGSMYSLF
jgi:hypothetical protein